MEQSDHTPTRKLARLRRWIDRQRTNAARIVMGSAGGAAAGMLWIEAGPKGLGYASAAALLTWAALGRPGAPDDEPREPRDWLGAVDRLDMQSKEWRQFVADRSPQMTPPASPDWTGYARKRSGIDRDPGATGHSFAAALRRSWEGRQ